MTWSPARGAGTLRLSNVWPNAAVSVEMTCRSTPARPCFPRLEDRHAPLPDLRRITRPGSTAIVEGFPSGVTLDTAVIDRELERRQGGYGRGKRQKLETDRVIVDAGIYHGVTTGGPDHAPPGEQRRQARAADRAPVPRAGTSTWPERSIIKPAFARCWSTPVPARRR